MNFFFTNKQPQIIMITTIIKEKYYREVNYNGKLATANEKG